MFFVVSLSSLLILIITSIFIALLHAKNIFLKVQAINICASLSIMFLMNYVYYINEPIFIDLALIYVIINYIGIIGVMKYVIINYTNKNKKVNK